jgi:hypothetical protein
MTDKKFMVTGVSTLEGKTKIRFANDGIRIKILEKNGHKDVRLVDLPKAMTKAEIAQYLKEIDFGAGNPAIEAAVAYIAKKNPAPAGHKVTAVMAEAVAA